MGAAPISQEESAEPAGTVREVFAAFLKLGLISFGGPVAHLGYFHQEFVVRRKWLREDAYADLLALCQFLPGPASSQMVFAIGKRRAGVAGALVGACCFTAPSAILMILFARGVGLAGDVQNAGWLHGLKLAAVAVVAQAAWIMGRRLCPDAPTKVMAAGAAGFVLAVHGPLGQTVAIACGALLGWSIYRRDHFETREIDAPLRLRAHPVAFCCWVAFATLLAALPIAASTTGNFMAQLFDSFYRAGALVFGGGHVVLPLLRAEVTPRGWVNDDIFMAGYGAAQALPGPLFTFAAFLGTVMRPGPFAWARGLWCLLAIFLPGWLLLGGALPFWEELRRKRWLQAALRGTNAVVVGLLLAALYKPVGTEAVQNFADAEGVLICFSLIEFLRVPPWLLVFLAAAGGQFLLR